MIRRKLFSNVIAIGLFVNERERGMAFGWYHLTVSINAIPSVRAVAALLEFQECINGRGIT
jgi:hypothetical protein